MRTSRQASYSEAHQRFYNDPMREAPAAPRETRLANGLTVIVQEVHTAPLASVWCWYKVGSKDERPGLTGVSHWVEHMNFKGTKNIPRDQVKGIIERFGGSWNGYTWIDQTTYFETATTDALDRMLFIEAERMANCLYHPDDCESERTVIISELQGGENDPDQLLDQELTATAFKAHTYRHPTIGWLSDLQTMSRDDLFGYYRRYYVPNNATLVVVGDVNADDVFRRAEQQFGAIPIGRGSEPDSNRRTGADRRAPARAPQGRDDRVLEGGVPCAGGGRRSLHAAPRARRGAHRRERIEPLVQFPCSAAAAQRPAVPRTRRARARVIRVRFARADRAAVSLHAVGDGDRWDPLASVEAAMLEELDRVAATGISEAELDESEGAAPCPPRLRQRQRHEHCPSARLLRDDLRAARVQ